MEAAVSNTLIMQTCINVLHRMEKTLTNSFRNILDMVTIVTLLKDIIRLNIVNYSNRNGQLEERYFYVPFCLNIRLMQIPS